MALLGVGRRDVPYKPVGARKWVDPLVRQCCPELQVAECGDRKFDLLLVGHVDFGIACEGGPVCIRCFAEVVETCNGISSLIGRWVRGIVAGDSRVGSKRLRRGVAVKRSCIAGDDADEVRFLSEDAVANGIITLNILDDRESRLTVVTRVRRIGDRRRIDVAR